MVQLRVMARWKNTIISITFRELLPRILLANHHFYSHTGDSFLSHVDSGELKGTSERVHQDCFLSSGLVLKVWLLTRSFSVRDDLQRSEKLSEPDSEKNSLLGDSRRGIFSNDNFWPCWQRWADTVSVSCCGGGNTSNIKAYLTFERKRLYSISLKAHQSLPD